jgi:predicted dehydrogenase
MSPKSITRRRFLSSSATTAAISVVPRSVLGGAGYVAPSDQVNIGFVGCGTQGLRQMMQALPHEDVRIAAVCDPNRGSSDYIPWSKNELRDKIRKFLSEPNWGENNNGCRCGREVGKEVVETYYGKNRRSGNYKGCSAYSDFRELLESEPGLDAIYIMPPDHLHATVAIASMRKGKHVITHKPISNVYRETVLAIETAKKTGLASHLFCSAGNRSTPQIAEWIASGEIGPVREVHNWSSRPFWPQGMTEYPREEISIPEGLDWDLWLGPVPHRPYNPALTHAVFRGWYEFGAGALGDMGHYSFYQIFKILDLGVPSAVEASRSQYYAIVDHLWEKQQNLVSYPRASKIHWNFPARGDRPEVSLYWYDGGLRPPLLQELESDGEQMPEEGLLFVGDRGKILAGFSAQRPRLIPKSRMEAFKEPPETLPRPIDEFEQWIRACKGGQPSDAAFDKVAPFAEAICLGNVALRVPGKLTWNASRGEFADSAEANGFLGRRAYRPGWELKA